MSIASLPDRVILSDPAHILWFCRGCAGPMPDVEKQWRQDYLQDRMIREKDQRVLSVHMDLHKLANEGYRSNRLRGVPVSSPLDDVHVVWGSYPWHLAVSNLLILAQYVRKDQIKEACEFIPFLDDEILIEMIPESFWELIENKGYTRRKSDIIGTFYRDSQKFWEILAKKTTQQQPRARKRNFLRFWTHS